MPYADLSERLDHVRARIASRVAVGGWTHDVQIVAVTKTHPVGAVRAAAEAGVVAVAENRVQEAIRKQDALDLPGVEWHLIGPLQRRKSRLVAGRFDLIHSIDRIELARALGDQVEGGARQSVLVQVNCSGESQKSGVLPAALLALLAEVRAVPQLRVSGLMTMAAYGADEITLHRTFGQLRQLRDTATREGHVLPELSMGMSDDFEIAVEEGATLLRLGTILFGARPDAP